MSELSSILITGVDERTIICRAEYLKGSDMFDTNPQVYVIAGNIEAVDLHDMLLHNGEKQINYTF